MNEDPTPPLPTQSLSVQTDAMPPELSKLPLTDRHFKKEPATVIVGYDRYAWKSHVANIEMFLRDVKGEAAYYCTSNERHTGVIVDVLAKHGPFVWCRNTNDEIIVVTEDHIHAIPADQPRRKASPTYQ